MSTYVATITYELPNSEDIDALTAAAVMVDRLSAVNEFHITGPRVEGQP